jgi:hypothetical protein
MAEQVQGRHQVFASWAALQILCFFVSLVEVSERSSASKNVRNHPESFLCELSGVSFRGQVCPSVNSESNVWLSAAVIPLH